MNDKQAKSKILKFINQHSADDWLEKRYGGYFMLIYGQGYYAVAEANRQSAYSIPYGITFQDIKTKREFNWFWNVKAMQASRQRMFEALEKDQEFGDKFFSDYLTGWNKFDQAARAEENISPGNLSRAELIKHLLKLFSIGGQQGQGYTIDCFLSFAGDDWFKQFITGRLKYKLSEQEINILREPTHRTFVNQAELLMLRAANKKVQGENIDKCLAQLVKDYYWINNNYLQARPLEEADFLEKIEKIERPEKKLQSELIRIKKAQAAKKQLLNKINASSLLVAFVKMADDFTYIQDCRKQVVLRLHHFFFAYLNDLAKRMNLEIEQILYLTPFELKDILKNTKNLLSVVEERKQGCLVYFDKNGCTVFNRSELDSLNLSDFFKDYTNVYQAKGMPACPGKARGVAKVILGSEQFASFQDGDILITNQTTPDFVPLMKKAQAVVAEQGGATSHAAIVSRELGVPCIVGAKDAMRIFNDGDEVTVDADQGIVRKLT